jgi:hypothetical protein
LAASTSRRSDSASPFFSCRARRRARFTFGGYERSSTAIAARYDASAFTRSFVRSYAEALGLDHAV